MYALVLAFLGLTFLVLRYTKYVRYVRYVHSVNGMRLRREDLAMPHILAPGTEFPSYCTDQRAMILNSKLRRRLGKDSFNMEETRLFRRMLNVFRDKPKCSTRKYLYRGLIGEPEALVKAYGNGNGNVISQFTATTWDENVAIFFARNRLHIDPDSTGIVLRIQLVQVQALDLSEVAGAREKYQREVVLPPGVVMVLESPQPYQVRDGIQYFDAVFAQLPEPLYTEFCQEFLPV